MTERSDAPASPSENPFASATEWQKYQAFEWLRNLALNNDEIGRIAGLCLSEWSKARKAQRSEIAAPSDMRDAVIALLNAIEMEQHNEDIFKGKWKKGSKAWSGEFVARMRKEAIEKGNAALQNTQSEPMNAHGGSTDAGGQGLPTPPSFEGLEKREEVIAKPLSSSVPCVVDALKSLRRLKNYLMAPRNPLHCDFTMAPILVKEAIDALERSPERSQP